jgi:hypothetical protein
MMRLVFVWVILLVQSVNAQFSPPAGMPGSTAVKLDSSIVIAWADSCVVERGPLHIMRPDSGFASYGMVENALGLADNVVVSLGDGGSATYYFASPLANRPGPDIAVFENSFSDYFLELAFVEISSDLVHFFRFPAVSNTSSLVQIASFGMLEPEQLHNLAGKYRGGYGTPFDFEELQNEPGLDIQQIRAVRVLDVIGTVDPDFASTDALGQLVNDPWPTDFESGGFDLDALAILDGTLGLADRPAFEGQVYPQPAAEQVFVRITSQLGKARQVRLVSAAGWSVAPEIIRSEADFLQLGLGKVPTGVYVLMIDFEHHSTQTKLVIVK